MLFTQSIKLFLVIKHQFDGDTKFPSDSIWLLSDAVTRLAFESTHYSSGSYNWMVKLQFVYINSNVRCLRVWLIAQRSLLGCLGSPPVFLFPLIKLYLFCLLSHSPLPARHKSCQPSQCHSVTVEGTLTGAVCLWLRHKSMQTNAVLHLSQGIRITVSLLSVDSSYSLSVSI